MKDVQTSAMQANDLDEANRIDAAIRVAEGATALTARSELAADIIKQKRYLYRWAGLGERVMEFLPDGSIGKGAMDEKAGVLRGSPASKC